MRLRCLSAVCVLLLAPLAARGEAGVDHLANQIEKAKEPRVRAQAALMLAASGSTRAIKPLCGGLDDESVLVRNAAARGLAELAEVEAIGCLSSYRNAPDASFRAEVGRALASLETLKNQKPRIYVSLHANPTEGGDGELLRLALAQLRKRLRAAGAALAPDDESKASATAMLKKHKVKGFQLNVGLQRIENGGVRMSLLCLTYPEKRILGEVSLKAAGAEPGELVRAMAPRIIADAAKTFSWSL